MTHGRHFEDINKQEKISFSCNKSSRLSKKSFVGFHMVRDHIRHSDFIWCERRDLSRSAASEPKKARSARQEVDLYQVYKSSCSKLYGKEARYNETSL